MLVNIIMIVVGIVFSCIFVGLLMIVDTFLNKKTVEDFSVAVSYEDIEAKKCSLAAGQYFDVKIEYVELTQEEFENKMSELTSNLQSYFDEGNALQKEIMEQLKKVKYE